MKNIQREEELEKMQKSEVETEKNEVELSSGWKLYNVVMCGVAFMFIYTGTNEKIFP